jgi:hypothetical protein
MWDTFRPLRLTTTWREHDKPEYAYSWNPDVELGSGSSAGKHLPAEEEGVTVAADGESPGAATVTGPSA